MHTNLARPYLSLGEAAELLSVQSWRIARLFELGVLPEPERVAGRRMIPTDMVPEVAEALREQIDPDAFIGKHYMIVVAAGRESGTRVEAVVPIPAT